MFRMLNTVYKFEQSKKKKKIENCLKLTMIKKSNNSFFLHTLQYTTQQNLSKIQYTAVNAVEMKRTEKEEEEEEEEGEQEKKKS